MNEITLLSVFFAFVLGVCIGSFLNVVVLRFRTGKGVGGRSMCLSCGHHLSTRELIPLVSFFVQHGKCLHCGVKISRQYPLVEFAGGLIGVMLIKMYPLGLPLDVRQLIYLTIDAIFWFTMLSIFVYDIRHKIIPNEWVSVVISIGLLHALMVWYALIPSWGGNLIVPVMPLWSDILAGPILALPLALLWLFSRGAWIGLGDAKLVLALGWYFGVAHGFTVFAFAFWIGAAQSIVLLSLPRKGFTIKSELPFAPFLIIAALIIYITHFSILNLKF